MALFFVIIFLITVCFFMGYFVGYNKGFNELEKIQQKIFRNPFVISENKVDDFLNEKADKEQIAKINSMANSFENKCNKKDDRP